MKLPFTHTPACWKWLALVLVGYVLSVTVSIASPVGKRHETPDLHPPTGRVAAKNREITLTRPATALAAPGKLLSTILPASFACDGTAPANIAFTNTGNTTTTGYITKYMLVDATSAAIVQVSGTPSFTAVGVGSYIAYAVNYDGAQAAPTLTTGTNFANIGGTCVNVSNGINYSICAPPVSLTVALADAPVCNPSTNQYTATGTVSLSNAAAGTMTLTDNGITIASIAVTAGQSSVPFSVSGLSNASSHSLVASLNSQTASTTYTAPAFCTLVMNVATGPLNCDPATGQYTATGTVSLTNSPAGTITVTDNGTTIGTITVTAGQSSATFPVSGLSNASSHTLVASLNSQTARTTYTAPASCTLAMRVAVAPPTCNPATDQYTATGTVSLTNSPAGTITVTDNGTTVGTITVTAGQSSATFSVSGLSNANSHTVVASFNGQTANTSYSAPVSCSLVMTVAVSAPVCNPATNQYAATGTISLVNATAGTITITDNGAPAGSVNVTAGQPSATFLLSGLSNLASHNIVVSLYGQTATTTFAAPIACAQTMTVGVNTPVCNPTTNQYTATGTVSLVNSTAGTLTVTDNGVTVSTITVTASQASASFTVNGQSNGSSHNVIATLNDQTASVIYTAPAACTICTLNITTSSLPAAVVGTAYNQSVVATGGTQPYTFLVSDGSLPVGMSLNGSTGLLSGTPTMAGTYTFNITVFDGANCSSIMALTLQVAGGPVCNLVATAVPGDCNPQNNTYILTGTISATNTAIFGVGVQSLTITDGQAITYATLNGDGPVSYTLTGLNSDGLRHRVTAVNSGTVCSLAIVDYYAPLSCTYTMGVTVSTPVCNSATNQYTATATVSLANSPAGTLTLTDNGAIVGSVQLVAGQPSASFTVSGPSNASSHNVIASLNGQTTTATYTAPTACTVCSLSFTTTSLPNAQVASAYSQALTAMGGSTPYTYALVSGSLPAGLSLNPATGVISGTPTTTGASTILVKVSDAKNCSALLTLTMQVASAPVCSLVATAVAGSCNPATNQYTLTGSVSATNGAASQSLTIAVGSVSTVVTLTGNGPVNYTLNGLTSDGLAKTVSVISSATACGSATTTYTAPAACRLSMAVAVSTPVCNSVTNQYTATGTVSLTNSPAATITVTDNGTTIGTITVTAGQPSASITVSGPSNASSHNVIASLNGQTTTTTYTAPTACTVCSLSFTTTSLPNAQVGTAYSQALTAMGGSTPYTYALVSGSLPAGLSLNPTTGVISGTPTTTGTASFVVKVSDAKNCSALLTLTMQVASAPVCSLVATAAAGSCNPATNQYTLTGSVSATNGAASQSLTIAVGNVSTVVTLTGNGPVNYTLSGLTSDGLAHTVSVISSATACGSATTTYTAPAACRLSMAVAVSTPVCNSVTNQYTATGTVSLTNSPAATITVTDNGTTIGTITVTAGQPSASFTVSGPSNASSHNVIASLNGQTATTTYTAPTACTVCSLSFTTTSLPNAQVGTAYSQALTAMGGSTPYTYALVSGSLPAGLSLNSTTGVISGTPTTTGASTILVKVSDAKNCSALLTLTMQVASAPVCSLVATAAAGSCNPATNQYTLTGSVSATNGAASQSLTIAVGNVSTVVTLTGNGPVNYTLNGLTSDGLAKTVSVISSATACGSATTTYTAPASCTYTCPPPIHVCKASNYVFSLSVTAGQSSYQWYRNGVAISGAMANSYQVTGAGSYSVVVNGIGGCINGSCCPVVIVEDSIANYQAVAQPATCNSTTNQTNQDGRIIVTNWMLSTTDTTMYHYQVSLGSSFNSNQVIAGSASTKVPSNGVLVANLASPAGDTGQAYTVRITNGLGCIRDVIVTLPKTNCNCPPTNCVPIVARKIRR